MKTDPRKRQITLRQVLGITYFFGTLLLAVAAILLVDHQLGAQLEQNLLADSKKVAERLAKDSRIALIQKAPENVRTGVAMARDFPNVEKVAIYTRDGEKLVGSISLDIAVAEIEAITLSQEGARLIREDNQRLFIAAPVIVDTYTDARDPFAVRDGDDVPATEHREQTLLGFVLLTVSKAAMHAAVRSIERQVLLLVVFMATLIFSVMMMVVAWITKPLKQLAQLMTDPETPKRHTQAPVYGVREVQDISVSFNALIQAVAESDDELVKANEALEARVLNRTQALSQANRELRHASEAKSRFLSKMSHEIRTPLHGVITSADLLMSSKALNPSQLDYVRTIHHSAHLLLDVIDGVLDFSKIEAGKIVLEAKDFDLHSVLHRVIMALSLQAAEKDLRLEVRIDPDTPYRLRGDPARISQILVNLVGNAVKFTERGYVRLKVFPLREDSTKTRVRFEVLDTGIGIPAEAQERIFDYFTQADESTARQYGGTGLGTAIAKRLVERMGGHLGVNSTVDEGSCFWFEVPLTKQPEPTLASTQRVISSLRALVVSAATRDSAAWSQTLRGWEIETAVARDGNGAVEAIREAVKQRLPFTTILVDERVTGRSAKAFPSELLRNIAGSATSVLLIGSPGETGEADDDLIDSGYAAIVRRPVDEARLYQALRATREVVQDQAGAPAPKNSLRSTEKSLRLLVAEDNPTNQFVIRNLLQEAGHRPCIVGDGKAALRALETDEFDLAIMDMHMPGFSGHEVVERHRQDRPGSDVPIIMLTADATLTAATVAHAAGVEAYLTKPVSADMLLAAIRRHALKVSPEIPAGDTVAQATAKAASRPMGASVVGEQQLVLQADVLERLRENIKTPDFVSQLVSTYIGDAKRNLKIIEKGFSNGAWDAVRHAAHDLKGASSAVGAEQVMRSCASVGQALGENREKELGRRVRRLSSEVSAVIKALEPYR